MEVIVDRIGLLLIGGNSLGAEGLLGIEGLSSRILWARRMLCRAGDTGADVEIEDIEEGLYSYAS